MEANSEFQKKQKVLIKHADKKTFIQTDKPVYKPGQIGMDRMPCLVRERVVLRPQSVGYSAVLSAGPAQEGWWASGFLLDFEGFGKISLLCQRAICHCEQGLYVSFDA